MAATVVDAGVLIGYLEAADAHHDRAVVALAAAEKRGDTFATPTSVYAELLVGPFRAGSAAVAKVEMVLRDFAVELVPLTSAIARQAAHLRAQHRSLRLPDAIVLATADALGAVRILTTDDAWRRFSKRAEIV